MHFVFCYFCAILYLLIVLFIHVLYLVYELNNNINTILQLIIINTRKAVQFWDTAKVKILSCLFLCSQLRGKSCYFDRKCSSNPLLPHCPPPTPPPGGLSTPLQLQGSIHNIVQSLRQITGTHSHKCIHITITTRCRASFPTTLESRHLSKVQRRKYYYPINRTTSKTHIELQYHQGATFNALLDTNYFRDEPFQAINCTGINNQTQITQRKYACMTAQRNFKKHVPKL